MDLRDKKILLVKLRYIGDTLSIVPVVENLAQKAPVGSIDVLVNRGTEPVLAHHPDIGRLWVYDYGLAKKMTYNSIKYQINLIRRLRSEQYHIVIDYTHGDRAALLCFLTGAPIRITHGHAGPLSQRLMNRFVDSDPSANHIVDHQLASLKILGLRDFERSVTLHIPLSTVQKVDRLAAEAGVSAKRPWIALHPGARGILRMWRPERFSEIARRLRRDYDAAIVLLGGKNEAKILRQVVDGMGFAPDFCSCELSLLETGEMLRRSVLFLGNDSAPGHLAAAVGCPTVSLFGPTFPHMWRPLSPRGEVVFKNVPCCGCRQEVCSRPEARCMDLIEVDEVWEKVQLVLDFSYDAAMKDIKEEERVNA
jgi:predicted lipopolysaccharide heptosyltransferase III